jgi:HlyD family type I secretion membrane fusion protein
VNLSKAPQKKNEFNRAFIELVSFFRRLFHLDSIAGPSAMGSLKSSNLLMASNDRLVKNALLFLLISAVIFIGWSVMVKLDSASVSAGMVVVESKRKSIEHLEGGIVAEVYVHEGQSVVAGTPLLKISDVSFITRLRQTQLTWISYQLQYQRLLAERDHLNYFTPKIDGSLFPDLTLDIQTLIANQQALFSSRVDMRTQELDIIDSRVSQSANRIASSSKMLQQKKLALSFLGDEIAMHNKLLKDGYTSKLKVLELKRSEVLLTSDIISVQSDLNEAASSVTELKQQKEAIKQRNTSDLENQISDIRNQLLSLESELKTAQDVQERTVIKSPSSGIVLGMKVNAPGEVVSPGEPIMEIIPNHDSLVIESLIQPNDIDAVKKGQMALIRLSAFNSRTTPVIHGEVFYVDADRTYQKEGDKTSSGYRIKIKLDQDELALNPEISLYPGMPAEVYVLLKQKSPLDFLLEPFKDSLFRSFRES